MSQPDNTRVAGDLAAITPSGAKESRLSSAPPRAAIAAKSGKVANGGGGGGGGFGGGGDATEDSDVARAYYSAAHLITSSDGLFVFSVVHLKSLPMKDSVQTPFVLTLRDR